MSEPRCGVLRCTAPPEVPWVVQQAWGEVFQELPLCTEHFQRLNAGEEYRLDVDAHAIALGDDVAAGGLAFVDNYTFDASAHDYLSSHPGRWFNLRLHTMAPGSGRQDLVVVQLDPAMCRSLAEMLTLMGGKAEDD